MAISSVTTLFGFLCLRQHLDFQQLVAGQVTDKERWILSLPVVGEVELPQSCAPSAARGGLRAAVLAATAQKLEVGK